MTACNASAITNLPLFDELGEHPKEVGGLGGFGALTEHEAYLPVCILHLGVGLRDVLYLLVGMAIETVRTVKDSFATAAYIQLAVHLRYQYEARLRNPYNDLLGTLCVNSCM